MYLFSSNDPHYKWLAFAIFGWCIMQFAELLLWLTNPMGCTEFNKLITMTLVPFALILQPLGALFGSLYVIPWAKSTDFRKRFIVLYSILVVLAVSYMHYYKSYKTCTTVTRGGHLDWSTSDPNLPDTPINVVLYFIWGLMISLPLFMFWNKNISAVLAVVFIPAFGFAYGLLNTDSRASIWCYYTSYTSAIASAFLLLKQTKIYDAINQ